MASQAGHENAGRENKHLIETFLAKRPRLVQMATRIIGCQCLAEDIVQETMLKICESGVEADVKSPTAYLFRMVRNLAIDGARRRGREMRLATAEDGVPELVSACPCPETTMARCQALRIVMAALAELPERTRHAFELHRIEGVSQRDIASRLKVSPTLVNFMVRDAHNHCRTRLMDLEAAGDILPEPAGRHARAEAAAQSAATATEAISAPTEGASGLAAPKPIVGKKSQKDSRVRHRKVALRRKHTAGEQGLSDRLSLAARPS